MPVTTYTTINGEIVSENRNGVKRDYLPDPLGNTVALLDANQQKTDTFSSWPYGELKSRTGTTPTPFRFGGTLGYRGESPGLAYVRHRSLDLNRGRWTTRDPLWPHPANSVYVFAEANPLRYVDPSGLLTIWDCPPRLSDATSDFCYKIWSRTYFTTNDITWAQKCLERTARESQVACHFRINMKMLECYRRFCDFGVVRCECDHTWAPCLGHCARSDVREGRDWIILCRDKIRGPKCGDVYGNASADRVQFTLWHEMFHHCGNWMTHGTWQGRSEPPSGWQCQDMAACCMLEAQTRGYNAKRCKRR